MGYRKPVLRPAYSRKLRFDLRIAHIITGLGTGGAETMLAKLIEALPPPEHEHVVMPLLSGGVLAARIAAAGGQIVDAGIPRSPRALLSLARLRRLVQEARADVVQGWMYHGNLVASLAASGKPVLWGIRQTLSSISHVRPMTRAVIIASVPFAFRTNRIIYNATLSAADHERLGFPAKKRAYIPNGFDTLRFRPMPEASAALRAELGLAENVRLIGRVARDDAIKDHETLFAAFARVASSDPACHLVCVGRGMLLGRPRLDALITQYGLAGRVHLLGERLNMPELTAAFDLALSTSRHSEGFSNAIGEAMAAGVPVIATDVGEAKEILGDSTRIVSAADPEALAECCLRLLALSPAQHAALGAADRARIEQRYGMPAVARRFALAWQEALNGIGPH